MLDLASLAVSQLDSDLLPGAGAGLVATSVALILRRWLLDTDTRALATLLTRLGGLLWTSAGAGAAEVACFGR